MPVAHFVRLLQSSRGWIRSAGVRSLILVALISGCGSEAAVTPVAPSSLSSATSDVPASSSTAPAPAQSPTPSPTSPDPAPAPPSPAPPAKSTVKLLDEFGGRALFPSSNWWNQDV